MMPGISGKHQPDTFHAGTNFVNIYESRYSQLNVLNPNQRDNRSTYHQWPYPLSTVRRLFDETYTRHHNNINYYVIKKHNTNYFSLFFYRQLPRRSKVMTVLLYRKTLAVRAHPTNPVLASGLCRKRVSNGIRPWSPKSKVCISFLSFQSQTLSDLPYFPRGKHSSITSHEMM